MARITANGVEFEYEIVGDPSAPAIIGVTGFTDQLIDWPDELIGQFVKAGYCFLRYDSRDMGLSTSFDQFGAPGMTRLVAAAFSKSLANSPYTMGDMANDCLALIDSLQLGPVHAIGFSMGGQILQLAALQRPDAFRSLSLLFTTSGDQALPLPSAGLFAKSVAAATDKPTREKAIKATLDLIEATNGSVYFKNVNEARADAEAAYDRAYTPSGAGRHLLAMFATPPYHHRLGELASIPTLILQASEDAFFTRENGQSLKDKIPGSELVIIQGAGHNLAHNLAPVLAGHILCHIKSLQVKNHA